MDSSVSPKDEILVPRVCHHILSAAYCRLTARCDQEVVLAGGQHRLRLVARLMATVCYLLLHLKMVWMEGPFMFVDT